MSGNRDANHLSVVFKAHYAHALGGTRYARNFAYGHTNYDTRVCDKHYVVGGIHQFEVDDGACFVGELARLAAFAGAGLHAVLTEGAAFAVAQLGNRQNVLGAALFDYSHIHDVIALFVHFYGAHAGRSSAHAAHVAFAETNALSERGSKHYVVAFGNSAYRDKLVAFVQHYRYLAHFSYGLEFGQRRFFVKSLTGCHYKAAFHIRAFLYRNDCGDALVGQKLQQIDYRSASRRSLGFGDEVRLYAIDLAFIGKEHKVVVRAGDEHVFHEVLFLGLVSGYARSAAVLSLIFGHGQAFYVPGSGSWK